MSRRHEDDGPLSNVRELGLPGLLVGLGTFPFYYLGCWLYGACLGLAAGRHLRMTAARCPAGHEVVLFGAWKCGHCPAVFDGHAWQDCPSCGERDHAISCACGRTVVSPISPMRGWP